MVAGVCFSQILRMSHRSRVPFLVLIGAVSWFPVAVSMAQEPSADGVWRAPASPPELRGAAEPWIQPEQRTLFALDAAALTPILDSAPQEFTAAARTTPRVLMLPMPDGTYDRFLVEESPVMHPDLAARYPEIRTFIGRGIDDPLASARIDWTPMGFHAQILSPTGAVYVDPYWKNDTGVVASYFKEDYRDVAKSWQCLVEGSGLPAARGLGPLAAGGLSSGATLRTYRLAMAATGEYTQFHGGTVPNAMAAIVTSVNRVTGIYEVELAIRFVLIANNNLIVFTNPLTDPYSNNNGSLMLGQNQSTVNSVIGSANYDIGHVFSTGGGGIASLASVCVSTLKARGVTGSSAPVGDPFDVDFVAHEIGHQFGGEHSFNGDSGNCSGGTRNGPTAYEPGSGSTIMAYAGICGNDDLQSNSDPYFHAISHENIYTYVSTGNGGSCPVATATGNNAPSVSAGPAYTIPMATPFALTASGSDPDPDPITYTWEEWDLGPQTDVSAPDNGSSPLFRSWPPSINPTRTFPRLKDLLDNTIAIGERLPTTSRTMEFRVTVRDHRAGGGGVASDNTSVTVDASSGPFVVTLPNSSALLSGEQTVTWDVAGTINAPVSASTVNIRLSTDGGQTFPILLAGGVPNSGGAQVVLPNLITSEARIKVEGNGNIFFDVSNANFLIEPVPGLAVLPPDPFSSSGLEGGPFSPPCADYILTNSSAMSLTWSAFASVPWVSLSPTGAVLVSMATNTLEVCISTSAQTLAVGSYAGTVTVTNLTDGTSETRDVSLNVLPVGGAIQFAAPAVQVIEGQPLVTAVVERVGSSAGAVGVTYATGNGTAFAGADYVATTGMLAWADGDMSPQDAVVQILDLPEVESDESFTLNLLNPTGGAQIGSPVTVTVTIEDDDSSDTCADAFVVDAIPFSRTEDTGSATTAGDPVPSCVGSLGKGVWYTFTPVADGLVNINTMGSDFDTGLAVYTGSCGALVEVACDDDGGPGLASAITIDVAQGVTYRILAGGYSGASGTLEFHLDYLICSESMVDGDFENGSPWSDWTIHSSTLFGTTICSVSECGTNTGAAPETGSNWIWFGGAGQDAELSTVGQVVTIPEGVAILRFSLWIGDVAILGTDELRIKVDGVTVDTFLEPLVEESGYTVREVNLDTYADGESHTIVFEYEDFGFGNSNFNVDNVSLLTCEADADLDGLPDSVDPDDDNDGIPDAWELQYGLNPLNPNDADLDVDGDGTTAFEEFIADTVPTNAASVLELRITLAPVTMDAQLEYDSSSNRLYFIDVLTNLVSDPWSSLQTNVPGSGGTNIVIVTNQGEAANFRLGAELP